MEYRMWAFFLILFAGCIETFANGTERTWTSDVTGVTGVVLNETTSDNYSKMMIDTNKDSICDYCEENFWGSEAEVYANFNYFLKIKNITYIKIDTNADLEPDIVQVWINNNEKIYVGPVLVEEGSYPEIYDLDNYLNDVNIEISNTIKQFNEGRLIL